VPLAEESRLLRAGLRDEELEQSTYLRNRTMVIQHEPELHSMRPLVYLPLGQLPRVLQFVSLRLLASSLSVAALALPHLTELTLLALMLSHG
jgi:hypothetical protein